MSDSNAKSSKSGGGSKSGMETGATDDIQTIHVYYDPAKGTVTTQENIVVPDMICVLEFILQSPDGGQPAGSYPTVPVQWLDSPTALSPTPQGFGVLRTGPYQFLITVCNKSPGGQIRDHRFTILVFDKGKFHRSDPTIINPPPEGPS